MKFVLVSSGRRSFQFFRRSLFFSDALHVDVVIRHHLFALFLDDFNFLIADFGHEVVDEPVRNVGEVGVGVEDSHVFRVSVVNVLEVVVASVDVHAHVPIIGRRNVKAKV